MVPVSSLPVPLGQTRVITAKLSHLIDAGFTGRAIAAITFTNKAAAEMAERFAQQRKLPASERPTISTFHSLGMKMLRTSGRGIGLKPSFSIFDSDDCAGLLAQLLQTTDRKLIKLASAKISLWKNALTEPEQALKEAAARASCASPAPSWNIRPRWTAIRPWTSTT